MLDQLESVACALCGKRESTRDLIVGPWVIVRCQVCSLVYLNPRPKASQLAAYYDESYFRGEKDPSQAVDFFASARQLTMAARTRLKWIARVRRRPPGRVLDVGAGAGYFLEAAKQDGWECYGVELSTAAASIAANKFRLRVYNGDLQAYSRAFPDERFDLITLFHVLEHLPDPGLALALARRMLLPGGLIVVETPDIGSLRARVLGRRWKMFVPPQHLYYFSRSTMLELLRQAGLSLVSAASTSSSALLSLAFGRNMSRTKALVIRHLDKLYWMKGLVSFAERAVGWDDCLLICAMANPPEGGSSGH